MKDDDRRKVLESTADSVDAVIKAHEEEMHPIFGECHVSRQMRQISGSLRQALAGGDGSAQVATQGYLAHWERMFGGKRPTVGRA